MLFRIVAETFQKLESTDKRLEMMDILSDLFSKCDTSNIDKVVYLTIGELRPTWEGVKVGMGEEFVIDAISLATGNEEHKIKSLFSDVGDLGIVAEKMVENKKQMVLSFDMLSVHSVYDALMHISKIEGQGSVDKKINTLTSLLNSASPLEAKYIIRIVLGNLRLGVGEPTILEALSLALTGSREFKSKLEEKYYIYPDIGQIAKLAKEDLNKIEDISMRVGIPILPALAERVPTAEEILEKHGGITSVEAKYDGLRVQVHKSGEHIEIFSRRLERITHMFPELVEAAKKLDKDLIFEGEAIGYDEITEQFYPFQITIQRKRKHNISETAMEIPLKVFVFDILYYDGINLINSNYSERRDLLERVFDSNDLYVPTDRNVVSSASDLESYFDYCVERGLEGVIAKQLDAQYIPGSRKFAWIKLKRSYKGSLTDSFDLVIVGYYRGKGKRADFGLSTLLCAAYDPDDDVFRTVAKVGSGLTEDQMVKLRDILSSTVIPKKPARVDSHLEPDFWVEPKYVITVVADEITHSPTHTCGWDGTKGYALRFPRIVGFIRSDKSPEQATTTYEIEEMFNNQKKVEVI